MSVLLDFLLGQPDHGLCLTDRPHRVMGVTSQVDSANALVTHEPVPAGWRPDIPAGSSLAVAPGQTALTPLVAMVAGRTASAMLSVDAMTHRRVQGPTTGDVIRLGDVGPRIEGECDDVAYGDAPGKVAPLGHLLVRQGAYLAW